MSAYLLISSSQEQVGTYLEKELNTPTQNNPDLHQINQDNQSIKIKDIRDIASQIIYRPNQNSHRVFVLYYFEKTTQAAQNAFLKTLEEHPAYINFVLHCTTLNGILETIQSRCISIRQAQDTEPPVRTQEKTQQYEEAWRKIQSGSYADLIDLASTYKDREEALLFVTEFISFLHQKNQLQPTLQTLFALKALSTCLTQLEQNANVLLTIENHLFAIKSRF
jgi:hypothetical protein